MSDHTDLKDILANKIPYEQERVKKFRKECGDVKIGEITVDMVTTYMLTLSILSAQEFDL